MTLRHKIELTELFFFALSVFQSTFFFFFFFYFVYLYPLHCYALYYFKINNNNYYYYKLSSPMKQKRDVIVEFAQLGLSVDFPAAAPHKNLMTACSKTHQTHQL
jgi:hypothetical protein